MATTVVVQGGTGARPWTHGLCGCFDNCGICIIAWFVPCVTFGQTAEILGKSCILYGCLFLIPLVDLVLLFMQRGEIRAARNIPGGCVGDFCAVWCCPWCAVVQHRQEAEIVQFEGEGGQSTVVVTTTQQQQEMARE